jgi:protein tyrosine/serine phosphatase
MEPPQLASRKSGGPRRRGWLVAAIVAGALTVAAPIAWNNGLRDALLPKNFGVVEPGRLYRSGQLSRWQVRRVLADNHITRIVALSNHGGHPADLAAEDQAAAELGVRRDVFPLGGDGTGQVREYVLAVSAIAAAERAGQPVLVHCIAGAQRTGGVIACYQLLVEHRPPAEVYAELRRFGHDPRDNPHLLAYLNEHMGEIAAGLVADGTIERVPDPLPVLTED